MQVTIINEPINKFGVLSLEGKTVNQFKQLTL